MKSATLGLAGVSAVGAGSAGTYWYVTSSKTVQDELTGMKLTSSLKLTQEEMKSQWQEAFTDDKDAIKAIISGITDDNNGGEALKNWCSSSLSKSPEKSLVDNVKKWCTVYTVEEKAKRNKKVLLNNESSTSDWKSVWTKNADSNKRTKIGLTGNKEENKKTQDVEAMKKWCDQKRKSEFLAKEKSTVYDVAIEWCSK
ncbi:hypothetical protein MHF_1307 [Mycoplasma haemofelis Ohio2]|uniref:Uncharacterized protein n=1 Tax=Mycoplasma haemofelis (strain Ohio2) TaxID=859194 RepID=F6FG45_MYCHI|nr:hypothetical protein MHF_1307 [Mycoplasma haemofelis Ohio2]